MDRTYAGAVSLPVLGKKQKGLVLRYIERLSGYTRQHVTKLVSQYRKSGHIRRRQRTLRGFEPK